MTSTDSDDNFSTVHTRLRSEFNSVLVVVHDDRTEYFAYWDESLDAIDASALGYLLEQGFEVLDAGCKECQITDQEQGWIEFRRHEPREVFGERGERR